MNDSGIRHWLAVAAAVTALLGLDAAPAWAVPSFARQTHLACSGCHTRFPKLNAFGRQFKLSGYTLGTQGAIEAKGKKGNQTLELVPLPPISAMFQTAYTHTADRVSGTQNDDIQFPQQLSLFLAGQIAPKTGSFLQLTYSQEDDKFSMDNADLRYATNASLGGKPVTYGVTLNNSPTVEDLWNSTPAWGFPFSAPDAAPSPAAATLVDGGLAQDSVGAGGYALWNQSIYVAAALYRSAHLGSTAPSIESESTIDHVAPYVRAAWQKVWGQNYLEVGVYGMWTDLIPDGVSGETNTYKDIAADFQYERPLRQGQLTVHGTLIHERQELDASVAAGDADNSSNDLDTARLDASYGVSDWEFALGLFSTTGDRDRQLYAPAEIEGSANGKPDSAGWMAQAAYFPWLNVQLLLQYTAYDRFNGRQSNYDGFGRDASDNDTLFLQAWFAW